MSILFTNNAITTLASGILAGDLSLTVATGTGALFPNPTGGDVFYATLANTGGSVEIVKVTARTSDTFTIVRAQDGTSALAWNSGDKVELRPIALAMGEMAQKSNNLSDLPSASTARTNLGLGTAAVKNTGTSGNVVPLLDGANTWSATQTPDNGTGAVSTTSTYTFDGADQVRNISLTNAITVTFGAPTGIVQYSYYTFILTAGDTSARTFAWNSAYKFPAATSPLTSGTTTSGAMDIITFIGGSSNTLIYVGHQADVR